MRILMPHDTKSASTGGGTTFCRNLISAMPESVQFVDSVDDADLLFIAGPTLCDRDTVRQAQAQKKPIVLRCDNVPEDQRNRGTGISRLKDFAEAASVVIFQSEWSRHMMEPIIGGNGKVIYNGVDTKIFKPSQTLKGPDEPAVFIYVKYSRNECKRFEEAQMLFREYSRRHPGAKLLIVGRYADELREYNMGFYNNENIEYLGILDHAQLAAAYRRANVFLFPSFGDACPNVVLEAMASGLPVVYHRWGGTKELVGDCGVPLDYDLLEPSQILEKAVEMRTGSIGIVGRVEGHYTLEAMAEQYLGVFKIATLEMGSVKADAL